MERERESLRVARAALLMAMSAGRSEEAELKQRFQFDGGGVVAVNVGGELTEVAAQVVQRAIVAARREGLISERHAHEGAVAGAARDAIAQVIPKAFGLNVGGKVGIAREREHLAVAVFCGVGLVHLNEVVVGLGHRALPGD